MKEMDIEELRKRLEAHGYELYKVTPFKKHDRIHFGNAQLKIALNLNDKLSHLALDAIVEACIRKER